VPSPREQLESESLGQLADRMQYGPAQPAHFYPAAAELERRRAAWQSAAAQAEQQAALAARSTAEYTKNTARYMLWSVIAILATSGVAAVLSALSYFWPRR
jgi:hypothetical protein